MTNHSGESTALSNTTNDALGTIGLTSPYIVEVDIEGTADILFHRWSDDAIAAKTSAAKGSAAKKTDDIDSYVWRCADNTIGIPGEYLRMAIVHAAKFKQDPRSPRKSAMDLYKAGVISLTQLASLGKADWDYLDRRRVTIQRSAITRVRPAFLAGWKAQFLLQVNLPEYIGAADLLETVSQAGRIIGIGDFRPTFGRFQVVRWEVLG